MVRKVTNSSKGIRKQYQSTASSMVDEGCLNSHVQVMASKAWLLTNYIMHSANPWFSHGRSHHQIFLVPSLLIHQPICIKGCHASDRVSSYLARQPDTSIPPVALTQPLPIYSASGWREPVRRQVTLIISRAVTRQHDHHPVRVRKEVEPEEETKGLDKTLRQPS